MADFWGYIKGIFQKAETSSPSNPILHELIERSEEHKVDYEHWKNTIVLPRLLQWLNDQYAVFLHRPDETDAGLDFLNTPSSKGFVIHLTETGYNRRDATHLFDFLKEKVLTLNYKTQLSDKRTYDRPKWVETVERHYLKPRSSGLQEGKFEQSYGNVMIELLLRNDEIYNLKFRTTTYRDHQYHEPAPFRELMGKVLFV